ncbi:SAF domain-containing protein [Obesumbacterium proteus]|uniref:SAF domain-containing protein n=1 Tax=Obesumbacterium proteus TaxID=82983 RepID=UPI00242D9A60|nr:SAF domain-containing protein [Obesumbacterium proteus]
MNHRMLFFLSIIVIAVGITGIFVQKKTPEVSEVKSAPQASHTIMVAEAIRELKPYDILGRDDYKITSIEISKESKDRRDISSLDNGDLQGYLIRHNISKGSIILPEMVESPKSPTFSAHSLRSNETPYSYKIKPEDEYLLSSLSIGDEVSLYIRLVEVDKSKKNNIGLVTEGSNSPDKNMKRYAISRVMGPISIVDIKKMPKATSKNYNGDDSVGMVVLRLDSQQLSELKVVEKAGEILLFPFDEYEDESNQKIRMDEVLPQFNSVKELRGGE